MTDKKDLQQPATKGDLEKSHEGLHKEIKNVDQRLSGQIKELDERLSAQIKELDERLSGQIQDTKDTLSGQIDGLAKLIKNQTEEFQIHKLTHQRQDDKLDDHEKRIVRLESSTP